MAIIGPTALSCMCHGVYLVGFEGNRCEEDRGEEMHMMQSSEW